MTGFCVVKFEDENLGRITPTSGVKLHDQKKFQPVSCKDLPDDKVYVKWQQSTVDGSFSSDGYFLADVLAIAGSIKTALAKAQEMNIRMHSSPILTLPEASQNPSPKSNKRKSRNGSAKQEVDAKPIAKQCELKQKEGDTKPLAKQSGKQEPKVSMKQLKPDANPKSQKRRSESTVDKVDKKKKKKLRMNDVSLDRCIVQAEEALQSNPLLKGIDDASDDDVPDGHAVDASNGMNAVTKPKDDLECGSDTQIKLSGKAEEIKSPSISRENDDDLDSTVSLKGSDGDSDTEAEPDSDKKEEPGPILSLKSKVEVAGSKLPDKVQDMNSASSESEEDSSSSSSDSDDEVIKLSKAKDLLQKQVDSLKKELSMCKRDLTIANNLRVANKDECRELKEKLQIQNKEINTLQKRNSMLQDLLCQTSSGTTDCKLVDSSYDEKQHSPSKDCLDTEKSETSTPKSKAPLCSPSLPSSSEKKRSKKSKENEVETKVIDEVCEKVLLHLKGENPLETDKQGFVDLGPVQVDKQAMEKNLQDFKGDVQKIAKGMATLAWTPQERAERSLEGGRNNRYPNAPAKKAASPMKVNACLGVVKAHLLHEGEKDGAGLRQNLKLGRRAIGARFSQDYSQTKK